MGLVSSSPANIARPHERTVGRLRCAAIVDRLTFGGNLIQTGTDSYRLAITQARAAAQDGKAD